MWDSPFFLEVYALQRTGDLSQDMQRCRLSDQYGGQRAPAWRRFLARRLVSLSLCLDNGAAVASLKAGLFPR